MQYSKLLATILLIFSLSVYAQSRGKKVLFLDLNKGAKEIEAARAAAKSKGDTLIIYPTKHFSEDELEEVLKSHKFDSIILSGHNGGSSYSGHNGSVSVPDLLSMLQRTSNDKVKSLYLLGCNTANKSKIFFWKEALPNLKFIAGYDGTAPLSDRPAGLKYFSDLYQKEDQLIKSRVPQNLKQMLQQIGHIQSLEASIYVNCEEQGEEFHFLAQRPVKERFSKLNTAECTQKLKEFKTTYHEKILKYWAGELEPTTEDPRTGFLRKAYTFIRQNEHCLGINSMDGMLDFNMNGDNMLFLLFNKDFNINFVDYYRPLLEETLALLNDIDKDPENFIRNQLKKWEEEKAHYLKTLEQLPKHKKAIDAEIEEIQKEIRAIETDPQFIRCVNTPQSSSCAGHNKRVSELFHKKDVLFVWKNIEYNLKLKEFDINNNQESNLRSALIYSKERLPETKNLIGKILQTPVPKRSDLMALNHSLGGDMISDFYPSMKGLKRSLNEMEQLSDSFPFSWHERLPGRSVEEPPAGLTLNDMRGYHEKPRNPQLEEIAKLVFSK